MGGGLQRIQRGYKSHTRELPPGMQGASTINPSLSSTLTLMINTLLPLEQEWSTQKSHDPDEQYKQDAYLN